MTFYTYDQNNSGGGFDYDAARGISCHVIVEAGSEVEADERAEHIGLYFDGAGDCSCCGERWYAADDGTEFPSVYGVTLVEYERHDPDLWVSGYNVFTHFKDGTIQGAVPGHARG